MPQNEETTQEKNWKGSWLWKKIVDNRAVIILLITLLVFLNILVLSHIIHIFRPLQIILEVIGPPMIFSVIFYYVFKPIVDWLEKKNFSRDSAIAVVFVILSLGIIGGMNFIVPVIQEQMETLIHNWPTYWNNLMLQLNALLNTEAFTEAMDQLRETGLLDAFTTESGNFMTATVGGIGSIIGTVTQVVITLFTTPFIVYYLLRDGTTFPNYILKFLPVKVRPRVKQVFHDIHLQISYYVRGQLVVAICVGIIFWAGYSIIGLDFALTLAIISGALNVIPYLGSFVAAIPAVIIALVNSPIMFAQLVVVFGVEQILENRIIQPHIIGNRLKIHPVIIIFILLVSGRLFGVMGIILGIPGYAILKIFMAMLFEWYQKHSGLYEGEKSPIETSGVLVDVTQRENQKKVKDEKNK